MVHKYPSAYICNTDPADLPGSHWVVFWMHSPGHAEFYESRECASILQHCFDAFLQNNCKNCLYNNVQIQQKESISCGYHVLFYVWMKCYNYLMS